MKKSFIQISDQTSTSRVPKIKKEEYQKTHVDEIAVMLSIIILIFIAFDFDERPKIA